MRLAFRVSWTEEHCNFVKWGKSGDSFLKSHERESLKSPESKIRESLLHYRGSSDGSFVRSSEYLKIRRRDSVYQSICIVKSHFPLFTRRTRCRGEYLTFSEFLQVFGVAGPRRTRRNLSEFIMTF